MEARRRNPLRRYPMAVSSACGISDSPSPRPRALNSPGRCGTPATNISSLGLNCGCVLRREQYTRYYTEFFWHGRGGFDGNAV